MQRKAGIVFLVISMLAALIISGCSNSTGANEDEDGKKVELTVWTWPDNDKTFEKTIPFFEKEHPNIKVKVQAFANDHYVEKLLSGLVSGKGPDVAMIEIGSVAKFKSSKGFVDLSKAPYNAGDLKGKYADFAWDYVNGENGKIFALPKNTGPGAMFYRRDLFEKAGLPTEPAEVHELMKTWDDYLEVGKKLTQKDKQWMVATPNELYSTILNQANISNFDEKGKLQLNKPDAVKALEYVDQANKEGIVSPFDKIWSEEWNATMKNGTVATYFIGNWFGGLLKDVFAQGTDGKWGVTLAPEYNGVSAFNNGGDFIGMLESSKHKDAAWEFIQFVTQNKDSLETMYTKNDLYPAWVDAQQAEWLKQPDGFFANQVLNEIFSQVSSEMHAPITNPNDPIAKEAIDTMITNITHGGKSVDEALKDVTKQIKAKVQN